PAALARCGKQGHEDLLWNDVRQALSPRRCAFVQCGYNPPSLEVLAVTEPHRRPLIDMVSRPEDEVDLARASLLVARDEYPELELDPYLQRLDTMAEPVRARLGPSPEDAVAGLNRVLFEEEGFRGNTREYY